MTQWAIAGTTPTDPFKAIRWFKVVFAVVSFVIIEGPVITWWTITRQDHKYSDREGDLRSPWRFGEGWGAPLKGLAYAHIGWLFDSDMTSPQKFYPGLLPPAPPGSATGAPGPGASDPPAPMAPQPGNGDRIMIR